MLMTNIILRYFLPQCINASVYLRVGSNRSLGVAMAISIQTIVAPLVFPST